MLEAGVNVALGTDAGDCANFMDMVRAMYLAALLFKDIRFDPRVMGAEVALEMATIRGARALGLEHEIGSLEPGKKADLVLFDATRPSGSRSTASPTTWSTPPRGTARTP